MPKKILIIEDEQYLVDMYKIKFEQENYELFTAAEGEGGIALAKKEKPDLILLDLVLPKMDGYQILKKLRSDEQTKNIKIYILSNLMQNDEINKSISGGADGYLIKANLTPSQLITKVNQIFKDKINGKKNEITVNEAAEKNEVLKKNEKVLIIDDEEAITNMFKLRFIKAGYSVEVAHNGGWGFKLANETPFAAIIMDMVMPAVDGYELIKKLKNNDKTKNIPVLILTNSAQDKDIEEAKKYGAAGCLLKSSITPAKLVKVVEKIINTHTNA